MTHNKNEIIATTWLGLAVLGGVAAIVLLILPFIVSADASSRHAFVAIYSDSKCATLETFETRDACGLTRAWTRGSSVSYVCLDELNAIERCGAVSPVETVVIESSPAAAGLAASCDTDTGIWLMGAHAAGRDNELGQNMLGVFMKGRAECGMSDPLTYGEQRAGTGSALAGLK